MLQPILQLIFLVQERIVLQNVRLELMLILIQLLDYVFLFVHQETLELLLQIYMVIQQL